MAEAKGKKNEGNGEGATTGAAPQTGATRMGIRLVPAGNSDKMTLTQFMYLSRWFVITVLAVLFVGCAVTDEHSATKLTVETTKAQAIQGRWTPGSRNYESTLGKFVILNNSILFERCRGMFTVVRDEAREDRMWNGLENGPKEMRYRDIGIRLSVDSTCEGRSGQVLRFLVSEGNPCYTNLMIYQSEKDLKDNRWVAWGGYHNESCMR